MRTFGRRVPVLLVLLSIVLIATDRWVSLTSLRAFGSAVFGSLESAASSAARWPSDTGRIESLERENARLRAALLARNDEQHRRDKGDKSDKSPEDGYRVVPAHTIGFGRDQTVTIDVGSAAGVARDMTVFDSDGLIGRVVQAGPATATVQLVTSPSASVGARLAGSREAGMVEGGVAKGGPDRGLLRLSLLNPEASVQVGDDVVTLGSPNLRPYVPGVPIGSVVSVEAASGGLTRTALVRPFARFTALDLVTVVLGPETTPKSSAPKSPEPKSPEPKDDKTKGDKR
ncbi:rod shape-determining protein MreC [Sphaerimonospora mesophila]|uniref:rod shape-determining protein MreC n=1 Tax=Sphaerimonospora mesophila TaxID=37483 RepID=UPI0006E2A075